MVNMILAYVPESEHLTYDEAQALALERDREAAEQLRLSVPDDEKLLSHFLSHEELVAQIIQREQEFRQQNPSYFSQYSPWGST